MIHEQFYRELGIFLYAIAKADGAVQEKEVKMIEKLVDEELELLKHTETDFQYKDVTLAKLSFYTCIRENMATVPARDAFLNFLRKHGSKMDPHHRAVALRLIRRIAKAQKGVGSAEAGFQAEAEKYLGD